MIKNLHQILTERIVFFNLTKQQVIVKHFEIRKNKFQQS